MGLTFGGGIGIVFGGAFGAPAGGLVWGAGAGLVIATVLFAIANNRRGGPPSQADDEAL